MPDPSDLTPAQEAEVRRRLAEARHDEPVPAEVAERFDRVLADLAEEPARTATVVRLSQRRRRAATLLVAAAAVVVAGVGIGQVVSGIDRSADNGLASGDAEPEAAEGGGEALEPGADAVGPDPTASDSVVGRIRPTRFADDVRRLRGTSPQALAEGELSKDEESGRASLGRADCTPGAWGRGVYRAVHYGDTTGYVVFRRPQGDTQVADLFLCGAEVATRSVTLPSP